MTDKSETEWTPTAVADAYVMWVKAKNAWRDAKKAALLAREEVASTRDEWAKALEEAENEEAEGDGDD